ncbi:MAG TPA: hypothetical protein VKU19_13600 [Bryobacteraceae bacterium]|nr:hypothetical protein [Bryobacteraceae bacterium]
MTANPVSAFIPAFEAIRGRLCTEREASWLKRTQWRDTSERESGTASLSDPASNADRIRRESTVYLPYYDNEKRGPVSVEPFAGRSDEKQQDIERHFRTHLPHRVASRAKIPTLRFLYEGGEPAPRVVQLARQSPDLLSEACYELIKLIDAWVDIEDSAFDKAAYFRRQLPRRLSDRLIDHFRGTAKHEYGRIKCANCGGTGSIDSGQKCTECRRGFIYVVRIDPIGNYVPDGAGDEDHSHIREEIDRRENPEERSLSSEALATVWAEVDRLPEFQRRLVYAIFWNGATQTEAAQQLSTNQPKINREKEKALDSLPRSKFDAVAEPAEPSRCTHRRSTLRDWWGEMRARHTPYAWNGFSGGANLAYVRPGGLETIEERTRKCRKQLADTPVGQGYTVVASYANTHTAPSSATHV